MAAQGRRIQRHRYSSPKPTGVRWPDIWQTFGESQRFLPIWFLICLLFLCYPCLWKNTSCWILLTGHHLPSVNKLSSFIILCRSSQINLLILSRTGKEKEQDLMCLKIGKQQVKIIKKATGMSLQPLNDSTSSILTCGGTPSWCIWGRAGFVPDVSGGSCPHSLCR